MGLFVLFNAFRYLTEVFSDDKATSEEMGTDGLIIAAVRILKTANK